MAGGDFGQRVRWLMFALSAGARPSGSSMFPVGATWADIEVRDGDVRAMFRRCIGGAPGGDVARVSIEDDLAILAFIRWEQGERLAQLNVQAIKTEGCDLETFYDPTDAVIRDFAYLRLDLDRFIGPIFTHPFPHVHSTPHEGVRYSLNGWRTANPLVDFLEHVYLQFYHDAWVAWARTIWQRHWNATGMAQDLNPFDQIIEAARANQFRVLESHAVEIDRLKRLLTVEKQSMFSLRADAARRDLLAYP